MFDRLRPLISDDDFKKIQKTRILLVGIGGVGGYALEALVRSGFLDITIIDGDNITISNLNRQIIALNSNIGESKVEVARARMIDINKNVKIKGINVRLTKENIYEYINLDYDYIIDASDDIPIKIELAKYAHNRGIKIIMCLGMGKRLNPKNIEITTLKKTYNDALAKKLRYQFKKEGIDLNIPVVFSSETSINTEGILGSAIFVPAASGIMLANYVFRDIIK